MLPDCIPCLTASLPDETLPSKLPKVSSFFFLSTTSSSPSDMFDQDTSKTNSRNYIFTDTIQKYIPKQKVHLININI